MAITFVCLEVEINTVGTVENEHGRSFAAVVGRVSARERMPLVDLPAQCLGRLNCWAARHGEGYH